MNYSASKKDRDSIVYKMLWMMDKDNVNFLIYKSDQNLHGNVRY